MATPRRRTIHSLATWIANEPYRFHFTQIVRILNRIGSLNSNIDNSAEDSLSNRFLLSGHASNAYTNQEIVSIEEFSSNPRDHQWLGELRVALVGLLGSAGKLFLDEMQNYVSSSERNIAEKELLDLFLNRFLRLYYESAIQGKPEYQYEQALTSSPEGTDTTKLLQLLMGIIQHDGVEEEQQEPQARLDEMIQNSPTSWSGPARSRLQLEKLLTHSFGVQVQIHEFQENWITLGKDQRTSIGCSNGNNILGQTTTLGERVKSYQNKFRVLIGPLTYSEFQNLAPCSDMHARMKQVIRTFVGWELDFDIQFELLANEVPELVLGKETCLRRNSWLLSNPCLRNRNDPIASGEVVSS